MSQRASDPVHNSRNLSTAFVACIEAGPLEQQVSRLAASLRKWGGRFAQAPFWALRPRGGPPISPRTRRALSDLGVVLVERPNVGEYGWYRFLNKARCLEIVERQASEPTLIFLDSDTLVVGEPAELDLVGANTFAACVRDDGDIASVGPGSRHERYWSAACDALQIDLEKVPFVRELSGGKSIRLYFNSGVFAYRRETGFGGEWRNACVALLRQRIAHHRTGIYFTEQIALGLTAWRMGMPLKQIGCSHNFNMMNNMLISTEHCRLLPEARILHYHDAMREANWHRFLMRLAEARPDVSDWLASQGPLGTKSTRSTLVQRAFQSLWRARRCLHLVRCHRF